MARGFLLLALTLFAHAPALGVGFLHDDLFHVLYAVRTHGVGGAVREAWLPRRGEEFYRPLTETTLFATCALAGPEPFWFRVTDLLLHGANVLLLLALGSRLAGRPAGLFAAALLALHPVAGRAVLWTSDRYVILATLAMNLSLAAYLRWQRQRRRTWLAAALAAAAAAQLSKESGLALPLLILVLEAGSQERAWGRALPFLGLTGLYLAFRYLTLGDLGGYRDPATGAPRWPLGPAAWAREFLWDLPRALLLPLNRAALAPAEVKALTGVLLAGLGLLLAGAGRRPPLRSLLRGLLLAAAALAPSLPYFYLGRDLLKAYHGYPAFLGLGLAAGAALRPPRAWGRTAWGGAILLLGAWLFLDRRHAGAWREATAVVTRLERGLRALTPPLRPERPLLLAGVPRAWRGALVVEPTALRETLVVLLGLPFRYAQGLGYPWVQVDAARARALLREGGRYLLFDPLSGRLLDRTASLRAPAPPRTLVAAGRPTCGSWSVTGPARRVAGGWLVAGRAARFRWRGPPFWTGRHWVLQVKLRARRLDGGSTARANLRWTERHYGQGGAHRLARWTVRCDGRWHTYRVELLRTGWVAEEIPVRTWTLSPGRKPMVVEVARVAWVE